MTTQEQIAELRALLAQHHALVRQLAEVGENLLNRLAHLEAAMQGDAPPAPQWFKEKLAQASPKAEPTQEKKRPITCPQCGTAGIRRGGVLNCPICDVRW